LPDEGYRHDADAIRARDQETEYRTTKEAADRGGRLSRS